MAYIWEVLSDPVIFIPRIEEAVSIARKLKFTDSPTWRDRDHYTVTKISKTHRLRSEVAPFEFSVVFGVGAK